MKKSLLSLLLLPLMLGACGPTEQTQESSTTSSQGSHQHISHNTDTTGNEDDEGEDNQHQEHQENEGDNEGGNNQEEHTGGNNNQGGNTGENEENHQQNSNISLDEWKEYEFHIGHEPAWNDDWDFYYGDTYKPFQSCFFECPVEELDYSGIKFFDKKEYLISPNFVSYPKVEVRFQFWISAKTSSKYKATANEPQFKIEEFDSSNKLLNVDNLELSKSDVHNNNTPTEKKIYIYQNQMTSFILRFNNFIPNGDTGYMPVLCKISLKGWQYA